MEAISAAMMLKALDGLAARAAATAENVANAGTPGYRPVRVGFEEALASAASQGTAAVRAVQPSLARVEDPVLGGELRLDLELATASSTASRYAALITLLDRQMQIGRLAVGGSK